MARRGRPRQFGAKRHPNGSVVRPGAKGDEQRARRDPREGSVAGTLVLLGTVNGGINHHEKLAGELFANTVNAWRRRVACSPNPNAAAANLEGGTGKTPERDPFLVTSAEEDAINRIVNRFNDMRDLICKAGMERPTLRVRVRGQKVWDALEAVFICDQVLDARAITRMRKHGLKPLVLHFGLTKENDRA
ncbi:MAG: hypothetical protein ACRECF_05405 [Methyloceanibacter sp.]